MIKKRKTSAGRPRGERQELLSRLQAAEDTLHALQSGAVDALVVTQAGNRQVVTVQGADLPYRLLLDQMYAGAVTLTPDGVIVYCNRRFAEIVGTPTTGVIGAPLRRFVVPAEQPAIDVLIEAGGRENQKGEMTFRAKTGVLVPVSVSFAPLRLPGDAGVNGVIGVVVDVSETKRQEVLRTQLIEQVVTAQDEERRRIARELHDETGQSLTALLVGLRTIEGSQTAAQAVELAQQLRETTAQTLVDLGRLWRGLHPGVLDDLGLAAAVTRHAEAFAQLQGIAVDVRTERLVADGLSPLLQATVYRVLQEALTNVAKHARARRVSVRLARDETAVLLRVQDDGIGLDRAVSSEAAAGNRQRLGLKGMRERAALFGGSVEVESQTGEGTTVVGRFPVRPW
jgi:PAS domain S-box-containing protein